MSSLFFTFLLLLLSVDYFISHFSFLFFIFPFHFPSLLSSLSRLWNFTSDHLTDQKKSHLKTVSHFHCIIIRDFIQVIAEWSSGFPYFLQFKSEFCNKEGVGFRKGRGPRDQIANIHWIMGKAREFQKNIYFCFIDYAKAFDYVEHNKLWKILKEMGIPDHLICLLRNLYAGQEATVRTGHGTTD